MKTAFDIWKLFVSPLECSIVSVPCDDWESGLCMLEHCGGFEKAGGGGGRVPLIVPFSTPPTLKYFLSSLVAWV